MLNHSKTGNCCLCAERTAIFPLTDSHGQIWWVCKTVTNPDLRNFTCYSVWEKQLTAPLLFRLSDF